MGFERGDFFGALLLLIIQNGQMFLVRSFLLPFDIMPRHDGSKCLLFGFNPLVQLSVAFCAACKAKRFQCLFERHAGFKPALAAGCERNEINMKMRRGFIHVQVSREHAQRWVALLEGLHVFVEHLPGKLSVFG